MATSLDRYLIAYQLSTTSAEDIMGPDEGEEFYIGRFTATNTDTTNNVTLTLWMLGNGMTPVDGSGGNYCDKITLPKGKTVTLDKLESQTLINQQRIHIKASVAAVVNLNCSGATET